MPAGPGNRRDLMTALTFALAPGSHERLFTILRFHGLYALTDRDGAAACDWLLAWSQRVAMGELGAAGRLYLPRRDELCVLFDTSLDEAILALDKVTLALNEVCVPFEVVVEAGVALLPDEASSPLGALERADRRLLPPDYDSGEQPSSGRHSRRGEAQPDARPVETPEEASLRLAG